MPKWGVKNKQLQQQWQRENKQNETDKLAFSQTAIDSHHTFILTMKHFSKSKNKKPKESHNCKYEFQKHLSGQALGRLQLRAEVYF